MSKMDDLIYDIEQLYIEGYGAKSIAVQLGCDIQLVHDWIKHIGVSEPEEFSPHSTINS